MTHLAFELRTNTPDALTADLAARVEASGYRSLWTNHPPDEDGLGHLAKMAAATTRITLGTSVFPLRLIVFTTNGSVVNTVLVTLNNFARPPGPTIPSLLKRSGCTGTRYT